MATKFRIILASHGKLAEGMLNTVQMLLGPQENMKAYCLSPDEDVDGFEQKLKEEIDTYGADNILFMTELLHGSPFNCLVNLTKEYDLHHISGTNLPTLMGAVLARDDEDASIDDVCSAAIEASQNSILDVRALLQSAEEDEDDDEL